MSAPRIATSTPRDQPTLLPLSDDDIARLEASRDNSSPAICGLGAILFVFALVLFFGRLDNLLVGAAKAAIPLALVILCGVLAVLLARGNRRIGGDLQGGQKQLRLEPLSKKQAAEKDFRLIFGELHVQVSAAQYEQAQLGQLWQLQVAPRSKLVLQARQL